MTSLSYWIQRADFSTTDYDPVDVAVALRALDTHPRQDELKLQAELENTGEEFCPPGIGFVDPDGPFLHVCPGADGRYLVHFHAKPAVSLLRPFATTVQTGEDLRRADVVELIQHFFQGQYARILQALGAARHAAAGALLLVFAAARCRHTSQVRHNRLASSWS